MKKQFTHYRFLMVFIGLFFAASYALSAYANAAHLPEFRDNGDPLPPADPIEMITLMDKTGENLPPEIGSGNNARSAALYMNRYVVVPSREDVTNVWVWDSENPDDDPFALNMGEDVIVPLTFPINYARTAGDAIYVSNLSLDPTGDGWAQGVFKIYRWNDLESGPEVVISFDALPGRLGDAFSIIGDPKSNGHIIAHINTTKEFRVWTFEDGVLINEDTPDLITLNIDPAHINNHGIYNEIPGEDDLYLVTSNDIGIMLADLEGEMHAYWGTSIIDKRAYDPNIFYYNGSRFLTYTINNEGNPDVGALYQIVDLSIGETLLDAFTAITNSNDLANRIVYSESLGAGHPFLTGVNDVGYNADGTPMVLAHVVGRGFFLDKMPPKFTLALEVSPYGDAGTVQGGGSYFEEESVEIIASPATDYLFVNWTGDTDHVADPDEANTTVTMPAENINLTANFTAVQTYSVNFSVAGDGEGNLTAEVDGVEISTGDEVTGGSDVLFTAEPEPTYRVKQWTLGGEVIMAGTETDTSQTYLHEGIEDEITVTVEFESVPYALHIKIEPDAEWGDVTINGDEPNFEDGNFFNADEKIMIEASAATGTYTFQNWRIDGVALDVHTSTFEFTMPPNDVTLAAHFRLTASPTHTLTLFAEPENGNEAKGAGEFLADEKVTVEAVAGAGYQFVNWTAAQAGFGSNDYKYTFDMPAGTLSLTANFEPVYAVTFDVKDVDGEPIENAIVTFDGEENEPGMYVFENIKEGTYEYSITADGFNDVEDSIEVTEDVTLDIEMTVKTYTVTFTVVDHDDAAIDDATITLGDHPNDMGVYAFGNIEAGTYTYTVTALGYFDVIGVLTVTETTEEKVVMEAEVYTVTFTVVNESGAAIDDAVVTLGDITNHAGNYVFANTQVGDHFYSVAAEFYFTVTGTLTVIDADLAKTVTMTLDLEPVEPLALNTLANMTGDHLPPQIGVGGNARAAALYMDRYIVVPSREDGPNVWVWDSYNPELPPFALDYGEDIIEPLTFPINYVRTAGDAIYVSNLSLNPTGDGWAQGVFQIYRWNDFESAPEVFLSYDEQPGRLGDAFSIIGDPKTEGHVIAHINTTNDFRVWSFENDELVGSATITLDVDVAHINNHGIYNAIPNEDDLFLVTSNNMGIMIANIEGEILVNIGTHIIDMKTYDPNIFYYNGNRYLTYTINNDINPEVGARYQIVDISTGDNVVEALEMIISSNVLAERIVHDMIMGPGTSDLLTATNQVTVNESDELVILAHVVGTGFVVETTDELPDKFVLDLLVEPAEAGTVTGTGQYTEGAHVPLVATPAAGYQFVKWTEGDDEISDMAEFVYTMPAGNVTLTAHFAELDEITTLAELRDLEPGVMVRFTGEAVIIAMDGFRNRKFIQDETAAILIDDNPGVITTEYQLYDVITDIVGKINIHNQMVQFQPAANTPEATENTPVEPVAFGLDELAPEDQAKLVVLHNVSFVGIQDGDVFVNGTNYTITDGLNTLVVRTDFWNVDYIGEEIPHTPVNLAGVILQFHETLQIVPRFADDMELLEVADLILNVRMSHYADLGEFDPDEDFVDVAGSFNFWGEVAMPMDPLGDEFMTYNIIIENLLVGETYEFKFRINGDWDTSEFPDGGPNREVTIVEENNEYTFWYNDDDPTDITEVHDHAFNLFPNPASNRVTIESDSNIQMIRISDLQGRIVKQLTVDGHEVTLNTSSLNNGLYIVNIYTASGVSVNKLQIRK